MKYIYNVYRKHKEIINYVIFGILTTLVSLVTYFLCTHIFLNPNNGIELQIANVISWIFAVTFAYVTNRIFVFKSKNKNKLKEIILFYLARITTLLIDMFTMFIMVTLLNINDTISKITVQFIVVILNYLFSKIIVFKNN